ncbi:hypothetical protein HK102_000407 [Quaeritorhiza haematococci]|nr:hypothetical protein HK102_000407 [Quaeritorhiza haematococci]
MSAPVPTVATGYPPSWHSNKGDADQYVRRYESENVMVPTMRSGLRTTLPLPPAFEEKYSDYGSGNYRIEPTPYRQIPRNVSSQYSQPPSQTEYGLGGPIAPVSWREPTRIIRHKWAPYPSDENPQNHGRDDGRPYYPQPQVGADRSAPAPSHYYPSSGHGQWAPFQPSIPSPHDQSVKSATPRLSPATTEATLATAMASSRSSRDLSPPPSKSNAGETRDLDSSNLHFTDHPRSRILPRPQPDMGENDFALAPLQHRGGGVNTQSHMTHNSNHISSEYHGHRNSHQPASSSLPPPLSRPQQQSQPREQDISPRSLAFTSSTSVRKVPAPVAQLQGDNPHAHRTIAQNQSPITPEPQKDSEAERQPKPSDREPVVNGSVNGNRKEKPAPLQIQQRPGVGDLAAKITEASKSLTQLSEEYQTMVQHSDNEKANNPKFISLNEQVVKISNLIHSLEEVFRAEKESDEIDLIRSKRARVPSPTTQYRKRKKRTPSGPGRCHSCSATETPEWRRGPAGARTLCNACGLIYAKVLRQRATNTDGSTSGLSIPSSHPSSAPSSSTPMPVSAPDLSDQARRRADARRHSRPGAGSHDISVSSSSVQLDTSNRIRPQQHSEHRNGPFHGVMAMAADSPTDSRSPPSATSSITQAFGTTSSPTESETNIPTSHHGNTTSLSLLSAVAHSDFTFSRRSMHEKNTGNMEEASRLFPETQGSQNQDLQGGTSAIEDINDQMQWRLSFNEGNKSVGTWSDDGSSLSPVSSPESSVAGSLKEVSPRTEVISIRNLTNE